MSKIYYPAVFHEAEKDEKGFWVEFPDFPGCITQGDTLEEAVEMAADVLGTWFEPNPLDQESFAKPSKPSDLKLDHDTDFVIMIEYNSIEWQKKYNSNAIKKTLTIPQWLNDIAEKNHVNFSKVLQNALMKELDV